MEDSRTKVSHGILDHSRVKGVGGRGCVRVSWYTVTVCAVSIQPLWQTPAGVMQKASRIFSRVHHLKFADVERIDLREIGARARLDPRQHGFELRSTDAFAREQAAQHLIR